MYAKKIREFSDDRLLSEKLPIFFKIGESYKLHCPNTKKFFGNPVEIAGKIGGFFMRFRFA